MAESFGENQSDTNSPLNAARIPYADAAVNASGGVADSWAEFKIELWFEGSIEDDGGCIELMSPYDHRDGRFSVVSPISDEWSSASWKDVPTGEVQ